MAAEKQRTLPTARRYIDCPRRKTGDTKSAEGQKKTGNRDNIRKQTRGCPSPRHAIVAKPERPKNNTADTNKAWPGSLAPPYWKCRDTGSFHMFPVSRDVFKVFKSILATDKPDQLNKGRDVREKGDYTMLDLVGTWRIENREIWQRYSDEREKMNTQIRSRRINVPSFVPRKNLQKSLCRLPGYDKRYQLINETYLIHGTLAEWVTTIAEGGCNPPKGEGGGALFGKGIYLAEDSCKNDQYVVGDSVLGAYPDLHKMIFPPGGEFPFPKPPYKAYYILLCRVLLGYSVNVTCVDADTRAMTNNFHNGQPIFPNPSERELATIPGIENPPMRYHSLVSKKAGAVVRFREIAIFHGNRVYPEYLICYSRK